MISRSAITYRHWSMKVGRNEPSLGEIVTAVGDLEQGISNICLTRKGSVPTEPLKGLDMDLYRDRHPSQAAAYLMRDLWEQLTMWCTRLIVSEVRIIQEDFSSFRFPAVWLPRGDIYERIAPTLDGNAFVTPVGPFQLGAESGA